MSVVVAEPVSFDENDDLPPPSYNPKPAAEEDNVKYKPVCPAFHIVFFFILGIILILLGIIDMIVFYVVPYKTIKDNKKKYPDFEFQKPDVGIVVIHFLLHINLIVLGITSISSINYNFCQSTSFLALIVFAGDIFVTLYILEVVFSACYIKFISKEDFTATQISDLLNASQPINTFFRFSRNI